MIRGGIRSKVALMAGALACGAAPGCSFALVEGPPADHLSRHYFDCTSSNLAPTVDAALGGLVGLSILSATNQSDGSANSTNVLEVTALGALMLASATYGYVKAAHCREAKEALSERLLEPAYPPLRLIPPAPPGPPAAGGVIPARPPAGVGDPWQQEGPPPAATWVSTTPPTPPPPPAASAPAVSPAGPAAPEPPPPAPAPTTTPRAPDGGAVAPTGSPQ